nr:PAS domain-containing protein [Lysobacter enzymogenes]
MAAALALGHARFGQDPHDVLPLLGLYLLAALAAWYDGVRGGAVAVAAALAAIVFWPGLRVQIGLAGCALFLAGASALVWIAATLRRRRNRLRLQQEQWSAVLAGVGDGVALIGRDARVLYLNPAAGRLLDVAPTIRAGAWPATCSTAGRRPCRTAPGRCDCAAPATNRYRPRRCRRGGRATRSPATRCSCANRAAPRKA